MWCCLYDCSFRFAPSKLPQSGSSERKLFSTNMPPVTHGPERDILTHTLSSLLRYHHLIQYIIFLDDTVQTGYFTKHNFSLRSLLDDPEFQQELQNTSTEPAPYFTQFRPASPILPTTPTETPYTKATVGFTDLRQSMHHMESTDTVAHTHTQSEGECEPQPCQELNPNLREQVQESIRR